MKKLQKLQKAQKVLALFAIATTLLLTGCGGTVNQGNLGLRTDFNGKLSESIEQPGWYWATFSHVHEYSTKLIAIELKNLTPKAKDKLLLKELDAVVYYQVVNPEVNVRKLELKYQGQTAAGPDGVRLPAWHFVDGVAKSELSDAVSQFDSMDLHTARHALEEQIQKQLQAKLNEADPGMFAVTSVRVTTLLTDPTIEAAIRNNVAKDSELAAVKKQVEINRQQALANEQTTVALTPAYLQHEYNQVLMSFSQHGGTVILDGSGNGAGKLLNIGAK